MSFSSSSDWMELYSVPRPQPHAIAGLFRDLAHNPVTVQILIRQCKQNLKCSRRQWI